MIKTIVIAALVAAVAAVPVDHIKAREEMIEYINSRPGVMWKAGRTGFHGKPVGVARDLCGVKDMSEADDNLLNAIASGEIKTVAADEPVKGWVGGPIPDNFDSAENWPKVRLT